MVAFLTFTGRSDLLFGLSPARHWVLPIPRFRVSIVNQLRHQRTIAPVCSTVMAHSHVLMVYKRMLTLAQRLPAADRGGARNQIRAAFRENRDERNEGR